ncbi:hypothetical protein [Priestia megaterium]|nr:hypothetical protein [Priestia megaterium]MED4737510.1 hypothetical protein [Priestia megaterium]
MIGKQSPARKLTAMSQAPYELIHSVCLSLDWRNLVMSQSYSLSVGADS